MLKIDDYAYTNALKHVHPAEKVGFALAFLLFTIMTKNLIIALHNLYSNEYMFGFNC